MATAYFCRGIRVSRNGGARRSRGPRRRSFRVVGSQRDYYNTPRKYDNPEGRLIRHCIYWLRSQGYAAGKIKTHGVWDNVRKTYRFDPEAWTGVPDILAFTPKIIFIETKVNNNRQSDPQIHFQECCRKAGISYLLIRSIEDLQNNISLQNT